MEWRFGVIIHPVLRYSLVVVGAMMVVIGALSAIGYGPFAPRMGIIAGKVTIGPFCPVEPPGGCPIPPGTYSSRSLVLNRPFFGPIYVPLNETGGFRASVEAGTYAITLTNCTYLGCGNALPRVVNIQPDQVTMVNIDIDTGIR